MTLSIRHMALCAVLATSSHLAWGQSQMPTATPAVTPNQTQSAPQFRYPEGNTPPSSTLRVREIPQTGTWGHGQPARPVTDSPESLQAYQRCQKNADREATDIADMQGRIAGCLNALNERRQQGQ